MALKLPADVRERIGDIAQTSMACALTGLRTSRLLSLLVRDVEHEGIVVEQHVREGRFQRSLALIAAFSALLGGLDVTYEHYRGYARGFAIQTVGPLPIAFAKQMMVAKGAWGWGMRRVMMDYNHWCAWGFLGEMLPWEDNRVELADETDQHGLRMAKITFGLHDNDKSLIKWGVAKTMEIMEAAGAEDVVREPRYAHLLGGARMGSDPRTSVVDSFGHTHDIPNLFICDGSTFSTQGSANPGLTIQALAARTADYLIAEGAGVTPRPARAHANPPIRYDLSPRGTAGRGMPRLKSKTPRMEIGLGGLAVGNKD